MSQSALSMKFQDHSTLFHDSYRHLLKNISVGVNKTYQYSSAKATQFKQMFLVFEFRYNLHVILKEKL